MSIDLRPVRTLTTIGLILLTAASLAARQSARKTEYRIGPDDVLSVNLYGQDPKYSREVTVRPDGKITLLLLDDVQAADLTPLELKAQLTRAYSKYFEEPVLLVDAKQINSRKVYISGEVARPGEYKLNGEMNIVQLIALAGDFTSWADREKIALIRKEPLPDGKLDKSFFNFKTIFDSKSTKPVPMLEPGDQVIVK